MLAPNLSDVSVQPCPVHDLLTLDARLFVESCDVAVFEGDAAQQAVAEFLAGDQLELAS